MALLMSGKAVFSSTLPTATVPSPKIGTWTPVLPRSRCGSLALSPRLGSVLPKSRAAPAALARMKLRRDSDKSWSIGASFAKVLAGIPVIDEVGPADHHFFPGLISPKNHLGRVGVIQVLGGIIEVGGAMNLRPLGDGPRLDEPVRTLPVKVVTRNPKKRLGLAVRIDDFVAEILAAQMHVRHEADDLAILLERPLRLHLVVIVPGRNREARIEDRQAIDLPLGRFLGENHTDGRTVFLSDAVRSVVHLENQLGAGGNLLGHSRLQQHRHVAGRGADQHAALPF